MGLWEQRMKMLYRGEYLPVKASDSMRWKYEGEECGCGVKEAMEHVLFECGSNERFISNWKGFFI